MRVGPAGERVDRGRAGGALAAAEDVGADDERVVGVEGAAGADQRLPPAAGAAGPAVAGEGVEDEDGVVAGGIEPAPGAVGDRDRSGGGRRVPGRAGRVRRSAGRRPLGCRSPRRPCAGAPAGVDANRRSPRRRACVVRVRSSRESTSSSPFAFARPARPGLARPQRGRRAVSCLYVARRERRGDTQNYHNGLRIWSQGATAGVYVIRPRSPSSHCRRIGTCPRATLCRAEVGRRAGDRRRTVLHR